MPAVIVDTFLSMDCLQKLDIFHNLWCVPLEMALKDGIWHSIHTTVNFQAFRRLEITGVQLANVPL